MKHFNLEMIQDSLCHYPDLSKDPVYYSTFIDPDHFNNLQCYINKTIWDHNAHIQNWWEYIARYTTSDDINPLIITCIL